MPEASTELECESPDVPSHCSAPSARVLSDPVCPSCFIPLYLSLKQEDYADNRQLLYARQPRRDTGKFPPPESSGTLDSLSRIMVAKRLQQVEPSHQGATRTTPRIYAGLDLKR